jgi:hypothetical protein
LTRPKAPLFDRWIEAKIAVGVGGALFVLPLVTGVHGWGLELFIAGGIICLLCYLFLTFKSPDSTAGKSD